MRNAEDFAAAMRHKAISLEFARPLSMSRPDPAPAGGPPLAARARSQALHAGRDHLTSRRRSAPPPRPCTGRASASALRTGASWRCSAPSPGSPRSASPRRPGSTRRPSSARCKVCATAGLSRRPARRGRRRNLFALTAAGLGVARPVGRSRGRSAKAPVARISRRGARAVAGFRRAHDAHARGAVIPRTERVIHRALTLQR